MFRIREEPEMYPEGREGAPCDRKQEVVDAEKAGGAQGKAGLLSGRVRPFPTGQQLESECEDTVRSTLAAACVHTHSADHAVICLKMSGLP